MIRVDLHIRRLVVHGRSRFDAAAFTRALREDIADAIGKGSAAGIGASMQSSATNRTPSGTRPHAEGHRGSDPSALIGRDVARQLLR